MVPHIPYDGLVVGGHRVGKLVGRGAFGVVYMVAGSRGRLVIKIQNASAFQLLQAEKKMCDMLLDLSDVPKIHAIGRNENLAWVVMDNAGDSVLELFQERHTYTFCRNTREAVAAFVVSGALQCLQKVHSKGVVHGDIHPGNIAFSWKAAGFNLIDFGAAVALGESSKCVNYLFGSLRLCTSPDSAPSPADDIASLAYLLYWMLYGFLPWQFWLSRRGYPTDLGRFLRSKSDENYSWRDSVQSLCPVFQNFISFALELPSSTPFDQIEYTGHIVALAELSINLFSTGQRS